MPHDQSTSPQPEEQSIETIDDVLQKTAREGARSLLQLSVNRDGSPAPFFHDFDAALQAIYGEDAGSLSASTVSRLQDAWHEEYDQWRKATLSSNQYAYIWADGVYFKARIEGDRSCILVMQRGTSVSNGDRVPELPARRPASLSV